MLQNEFGDIFKLTFNLSDKNKSEVIGMELEYFDSVSPCTSLSFTKFGLFCAA